MAKILIVDDAAFMRKVIRDMLAKNGYDDVTEAVDGKEAALAGIAAQEAFFRSIGMPVRIPALSCGRQDEAGLADLASRCSYGRTRTIGTFRVLGYDDILAVYQLANNEE